MATKSSSISLNDSVSTIPGVGSFRAAQLAKLGIQNIKQLIYYIPVKYRDTTGLISILELKTLGLGSIVGHIESIKLSYTRNHKAIVKATISDGTGSVSVLWFNQPFIIRAITQGEKYVMTLKLPQKPGAKDFYCKDYEFIDPLEIEAQSQANGERSSLGKISPIYSQTAGLTSKWLRGKIKWVLENNPEILSNWISQFARDNAKKKSEPIMDINKAINDLHFPPSITEKETAQKRLALEEMIELAYALHESKLEIVHKKTAAISYKKEALSQFILQLPYSLTDDQVKAINEIMKDLDSTTPMSRLLNGDVGSGKTVVAVAAMYMALINGFSTILLAPTTILANQHFNSISKLFGISDDNSVFSQHNPIKLITSATKLKDLETDTPQIIVSTHAILYKKELPENIGLLIVDEQHRFGVEQRESLLRKLKIAPHFLNMTATPIPRTLTNILYEEESISVIAEKPSQRKEIITKMVGPTKQDAFYKWLEDKIVDSSFEEQAFIILPLIDGENESLKDVTKQLKQLTKLLPKLKIEALHGRLKEQEKNDILTRFGKKEIHLLISTTVIEVGIDYPDATVIAIENAERFGLAQLHQLRGRVGRGAKQSYCFVLPTAEKADDDELPATESAERLKYFCSHNSGFELAEFDLESRGPGAVQGLKQSGLPAFKVASYTDTKTLTIAKELMKKAKYIKPENNLLELF